MVLVFTGTLDVLLRLPRLYEMIAIIIIDRSHITVDFDSFQMISQSQSTGSLSTLGESRVEESIVGESTSWAVWFPHLSRVSGEFTFSVCVSCFIGACDSSLPSSCFTRS